MAGVSFPTLPAKELRAFLTSIHAFPDDDGPRLIFADWLEENDDPRGEFIRIQCARSGTDKKSPDYPKLKAQEKGWLKHYRKAWEKELDTRWTVDFERGLPFVYDWDDECGPFLPLETLSKKFLSNVATGWLSRVWIMLLDVAFIAELRAAPWKNTPCPLGLQFSDEFGFRLTNATLARIAELKQLQGVRCIHQPVTNAGLTELTKLKNLRSLWLHDSQVSNKGLPQLLKLKRLEELVLSSTGVTDAGLRHLAGLIGLRTLSLGSTSITDDGLEHLSTLSALGTLDLWATEITDTGLTHLTGLTALKELDLRDTDVTDKGVARLRKALPQHLKVER